ncbi:hypothetical protein B0F90DRAFT_1752873 [Multifurca ochricompacta]|uniref:Transmembrane protein n=1 Tax=Multifurca ochricompacta TaxID=376703 RepID=A0AAD4QI14_9AGAM|nr:hypothetical protein B0F90DRAFT_1752873 [Multifurca ochricompacta]
MVLHTQFIYFFAPATFTLSIGISIPSFIQPRLCAQSPPFRRRCHGRPRLRSSQRFLFCHKCIPICCINISGLFVFSPLTWVQHFSPPPTYIASKLELREPIYAREMVDKERKKEFLLKKGPTSRFVLISPWFIYLSPGGITLVHLGALLF